MEIIEVSDKEYAVIFPAPYHVFNTAAFNALNSYKCDHVSYLVFKDSKVRIGLILGEKVNMAYSPFSAPFGGFSFLSNQLRQQRIAKAHALHGDARIL